MMIHSSSKSAWIFEVHARRLQVREPRTRQIIAGVIVLQLSKLWVVAVVVVESTILIFADGDARRSKYWSVHHRLGCPTIRCKPPIHKTPGIKMV